MTTAKQKKRTSVKPGSSTGYVTAGVRMSPALQARVNRWIDSMPVKPKRITALVYLIAKGLDAEERADEAFRQSTETDR